MSISICPILFMAFYCLLISSTSAHSWVTIKYTGGTPALSLSALVLSQAASVTSLASSASSTNMIDDDDNNNLNLIQRPVGDDELEEMYQHSLSGRREGDEDAAQRNFQRRLKRKFPRMKLGQVLPFTSKRLQKVLMFPSVDLMVVDIPQEVRVQNMQMQADRKNVRIPNLNKLCQSCKVLSHELNYAASRSPGALVTRIKKVNPKTFDHKKEASMPLGLIREALKDSYQTGIVPFSVDSCNQSYCDLAMLYRGGWYVLPFYSKSTAFSEKTTAADITSDLNQLLATVVHSLHSTSDIQSFTKHQSTTVLVIQHDNTTTNAMNLYDNSMKKLTDSLGGDIPVGWCIDSDLPPLLSVYRRMAKQRSPKQILQKLPTIVVFRNFVGHSVEESVFTFTKKKDKNPSTITSSTTTTTCNDDGSTTTTKQTIVHKSDNGMHEGEKKREVDLVQKERLGKGRKVSTVNNKENENEVKWSDDYFSSLVTFIYRARLGLLEKWTPTTENWYQDATLPSMFLLLNSTRISKHAQKQSGSYNRKIRMLSSAEDEKARKAMLLFATANIHQYKCATIARNEQYHADIMQIFKLTEKDLPVVVRRDEKNLDLIQLHYVVEKNVDLKMETLHQFHFHSQLVGLFVQVPQKAEVLQEIREGNEKNSKKKSKKNNKGYFETAEERIAMAKKNIKKKNKKNLEKKEKQEITRIGASAEEDGKKVGVLASLFAWMSNSGEDKTFEGTPASIADRLMTEEVFNKLQKMENSEKFTMGTMGNTLKVGPADVFSVLGIDVTDSSFKSPERKLALTAVYEKYLDMGRKRLSSKTIKKKKKNKKKKPRNVKDFNGMLADIGGKNLGTLKIQKLKLQ